MAFLTVNLSEIMTAVNMRSQTKSIFNKDLIKNFNWWLLGAVVITVGLTLIAIYMPGLSNVFDIVPGTFELKELLIFMTVSAAGLPD